MPPKAPFPKKATLESGQNQMSQIINYSETEVESLLGMYKRYMELEEEIKSPKATDTTNTRTPFSLLIGTKGKMVNMDPLQEQKKEQKDLGEKMKFQNPYIWMLYKFLAYKNTNGSIDDVQTLKAHCNVDGICHKRFDFINKYLFSKYGKNFDTGLFEENMSLDDVLKDDRYRSMLLDTEFMRSWAQYENSKVGKWVEYKV